MNFKKYRTAFTSIMKYFLFKTGFFSLIRFLYPNKNIAILRYHSIADNKKNFYCSPMISISPKAFEKHIKYFSKRYNVISLDRVLHYMENNRPFPLNAIVFTFDDGYADNYAAAQILKKYGLTGTFYLTAGCIGNKKSLWLFDVIYLITNSKSRLINLEIKNEEITFDLDDANKKNKAIQGITTLIKSNDIATREEILKQLKEKLEVSGLEEVSRDILLSWEQVKTMISQGMIIGAHTMTHCNLPNARIEEAIKEINECMVLLEEKLKINIRHFSYPNSGNYEYYNDQIISLVKDAGFQSATTSENGFVTLKSNPFTVNRVRTVEELHEIVYLLEGERLKNRSMKPT